MEVRDKVAKFLEKHGMSKAELSRRMGFSQSGLAKLLKGENPFKDYHCILLEVALGIDRNWFKNGLDDDPTYIKHSASEKTPSLPIPVYSFLNYSLSHATPKHTIYLTTNFCYDFFRNDHSDLIFMSSEINFLDEISMGDLLVFKKTFSQKLHGGIYLYDVNEKVSFFKVKHDLNGESLINNKGGVEVEYPLSEENCDRVEKFGKPLGFLIWCGKNISASM